MRCRAWKCVPTAISSSLGISEVPACHLIRQISFQWGSQKLLQGSMSHELTSYFFDSNSFDFNLNETAILSGNFESCSSLILNFNQYLATRWVSFLIKLQVSWSWSFCAGLFSRKLSEFLFMFSTCVSCFIFLYRSFSWSLCTIFDAISSNIDEALSNIPFANAFGDFRIYYKDWLTYSGRTDKPGELCHNFSVSDYLIQMVNLIKWSLAVTNAILLFRIYLFLLTQVFVLQWHFLY